MPFHIDGTGFTDWPVAKALQDRIAGIIALPALHERTAGADLTEMLSKNLTFEAALADDSPLHIMPRHRLRRVRDTIFNNIAFIAAAKDAAE